MDTKTPSQIDIIEFPTKINKDEYKIEKENEKKTYQNWNYWMEKEKETELIKIKKTNGIRNFKQ